MYRTKARNLPENIKFKVVLHFVIKYRGMKNYFIFLVLVLLLGSCSSETPESYITKSETFKSKIGPREVHGIRLYISSPQNISENAGFQVQLNQGSKVWIDTLKVSLAPGDTIESEVIFTESDGQIEDISFKTDYFSIGH